MTKIFLCWIIFQCCTSRFLSLSHRYLFWTPKVTSLPVCICWFNIFIPLKSKWQIIDLRFLVNIPNLRDKDTTAEASLKMQHIKNKRNERGQQMFVSVLIVPVWFSLQPMDSRTEKLLQQPKHLELSQGKPLAVGARHICPLSHTHPAPTCKTHGCPWDVMDGGGPERRQVFREQKKKNNNLSLHPQSEKY